MHDIVEFLRRHAPFDDLDEQQLEELARATEVEFFGAGTTVFRQGEGTVEHVRIIRKGSIELVSDGRVLDVLGEGELFGHPSMLSGFPPWFEARSGEDTLCYRFVAGSVLPYLGRPAGLRYVAQSLVDRPARGAPHETAINRGGEPVSRLVQGPAVVCEPAWSVREVAGQMADNEAEAALVRLAEGGLGIVTDRDLRDRVVAGGVGLDAQVTEVMTAPAVTVTPERSGDEAMLEMLDRDVHHLPVVWPHGDVLGILSDRDLLLAGTQAPFASRREVSEATSVRDLRLAAERLPAAVVALHEAEAPPSRIAAIISVVTDAITRRLIHLAVNELGPAPAPLAWMALGSLGRREMVPSSDIESGLVWAHPGEGKAAEYMGTLGTRVVAGLREAGFEVDAHGATPEHRLFDRSFGSWRTAVRDVIEDPEREKGLIFISLLADARFAYRLGDVRNPLEELAQIRNRRPLLRLLLRLALVHRPPTGLRRLRPGRRGDDDGASAAPRGRIDIKTGGLLPIVGIARYASLAAGGHATGTRDRLRFSATAGTLEGEDARALSDAFDLFWRLRVGHQVEQLRKGIEPDDYIDPESLTPVTRGYLREAFHGVASVQRALRGELELPP
jgi:CBS domain-containing protein